MNIDSSRHTAYKIWLDELNTVPADVFFLTFKQFLDLLITENPDKIENLRDIIDDQTKNLVDSANKAVKELEKLLYEVEQEANKAEIKPLPEIEHYKQVKNGEIKVMGQDLPDTLYHAIRLTIEAHRKDDKLKVFDRLLSVNDDFWYLDYAKVCEAYPAYKQFKDIKDEFEQKRVEEPWGAYIYLKWAPIFFKNVTPEQAGSFVRTDIISALRRFILYLLTPSPITNKKEVIEEETVYEITYTPTREILLNKTIRLAKPDFDSENDVVFDYLYNHPNQKISLKELETQIKKTLTKSLHKIVENLGFKGDLKTVFFTVSQDAVSFRNPITQDDLEKLGISKIKLP